MGANKLLSREQQLNTDFYNAMAPLHEMVANTGVKSGLRFQETLVAAISAFGTCELYSRQAERCEAMQVALDVAKEARQRAQSYQEAGLEQLVRTRNMLREFRAEFDKLAGKAYKKRSQPTDLADRIDTGFQRALCDLEVKASDVLKINDAVRWAFDVGRSGSVEDLFSYLERGIDQLEEARQREDRGTSDNISFWKWAGIFAIAGGLAHVILTCLTLPFACPDWMQAFEALIVAVGGILNSYC
jgi:hypothetical protein